MKNIEISTKEFKIPGENRCFQNRKRTPLGAFKRRLDLKKL